MVTFWGEENFLYLYCGEHTGAYISKIHLVLKLGAFFWRINYTSKKVDLKRKGLEKAMVRLSLCNLKNK